MPKTTKKFEKSDSPGKDVEKSDADGTLKADRFFGSSENAPPDTGPIKGAPQADDGRFGRKI